MDQEAEVFELFKTERIRKLHELCDFVENVVDSSAMMTQKQFTIIVCMCRDINEKAFGVAHEKLGLNGSRVSEWINAHHKPYPSGVSAIFIARALLHELRQGIGARPTPRTVREPSGTDKTGPVIQEIPEGVVLAEGFLPDVDLDTLPEWMELSTRLRNSLKNNNRSRLIDVLRMNGKEFLGLSNVSTKSLEELVTWCHRRGIRGKFFDHPKAVAVVKQLEENAENFKLGGDVA